MVDYQRPSFEISSRDPVAIESQYPPLHYDRDPAIFFAAAVAGPDDRIVATPIALVVGASRRIDQVNGVDVAVEILPSSVSASWIQDGISYHLTAFHEGWLGSELDSRLEPLVEAMTSRE